VFAFIVLASVALVGFERYTSWFRINRLQKAADLMVRLQEIQAHGTNSTPELERLRVSVTRQALELIEPRPTLLPSLPPTSGQTLARFFAGSAFWWAAILVALWRVGWKVAKRDITLNLALAIICGSFATAIPEFWWPWFHLFMLPFLLAVVVAVPVTLLYPIWMGLKRAKERAQEIGCSSNLKQIGLAARLYANEHGDMLPKDFESVPEELLDRRVICCSKDRSTRYTILSPGVSEADPSVVFAQCPIHKHMLLADGSVQSPRVGKLFQDNGQWRIRFFASAASS
jgi:hypothetical protein